MKLFVARTCRRARRARCGSGRAARRAFAPHGCRSRGGAAALATTQRFDLVGLHWRGAGTGRVPHASRRRRVERLARRGARGGGSADAATAEAPRDAGWRLGNPCWTGPSDGHPGTALRGRVTPRSARTSSRSSGRRRPGADAPAGGARRRRSSRARAWHADESIRRATPQLRARRSSSRSSTTRPARTPTRRPVGGDRAGDRALPREGERLERHRLQLPRRQVRPGLRGPLRRHRAQRRRRPRGGLQHRLGRRRGARQLRLRGADRRPRATRSSELLAWRLDVAHVDPLGDARRTSRAATRAFPPARRSSCAPSRATGTPASPTAPARSALRAARLDRRQASRHGLPKIYEPSVVGKPRRAGAVHRRGSPRRSPWTVTVHDPAGDVGRDRTRARAPRSTGRGTRRRCRRAATRTRSTQAARVP